MLTTVYHITCVTTSLSTARSIRSLPRTLCDLVGKGAPIGMPVSMVEQWMRAGMDLLLQLDYVAVPHEAVVGKARHGGR